MPTIYSEGYSAIWEMWAELFHKQVMASVLCGQKALPLHSGRILATLASGVAP